MPTHRRRVPAWRIPVPAMAGAVVAATVALAVSVPMALAEPAIPSPPPVAAVTVPPVPPPPTMIVYDDDPGRGAERCDVFRSFFVPDEVTCTVMATAFGPSPERARAGMQWWIDNQRGEVNPK